MVRFHEEGRLNSALGHVAIASPGIAIHGTHGEAALLTGEFGAGAFEQFSSALWRDRGEVTEDAQSLPGHGRGVAPPKRGPGGEDAVLHQERLSIGPVLSRQ